jgi:prepilin-type N-terminal cleavage/methylation domain-containing protein
MKRQKNNQSGFTLVELSIVLVIIGLIVSSVLVGQTLVRSAELRSTLTQLESFNSAIGTFRGKYNGLPGDVLGAANFGFTGNGDANGVLYAASSATGMSGTSENNYFWNHLGSSGASLISGSYTGSTALTATTISGALPSAKSGNYWGVFAGRATTTAEVASSVLESGFNYYILGVTGDGTSGAFTTAVTLTPLEAQSLDSKIDDGKPSLGTVRARGAGTDAPDTVPTSAISSGASADVCVYFVATAYTTAPSTNTYNVKNGVSQLCTLRFKMPL